MLYLKCKGQVMSVDVDERIADQYINANTVHFEFCERWNGMTITAQFTQDGKTYNKLVDEVTSTVILPNEIMAGKVEISAFGVHPVTGVRITTIPVKKTIDKSGFVGDGELSIPPTPDLYAQLLEKVNKTAIPHIGANGNWWFDDWDSGVAATAEVDAARQAAVNEINRAAANQMVEMDNKFANTMQDIPETYTELDATVKSLKDTKADAIRDTSAKAASHELHAQDGPMSVTLYGKTVETGTGEKSPENPYVINGVDAARVHCGSANLIPFPYYNGNTTKNGVTFTVNSDGTVIANGTATGNANIVLSYQTLYPGTYYISGCPSGGSTGKFRLQINKTRNGVGIATLAFETGNGATIVITERTDIEIYFVVLPGNTMSNAVIKPMLTRAPHTEYVPYNANVIDMPLLPDGDPLMDGDTVENDVLSGCDKCITMDGSSDENWYMYAGLNGGNSAFALTGVTDLDASNPYDTLSYSTHLPHMDGAALSTYKPTDKGFIARANMSQIILISPEYAGMSVDEFRTHLAANPLTVYYRSAEYTPEKDLRVCRVTRCMKSFTLDESDTPYRRDVNGNVAQYMFISKPIKSPGSLRSGYCDKFTYGGYSDAINTIVVGSDANVYLRVDAGKFKTLEDMTLWLASNHITAYYHIPTPEVYYTDHHDLRKPYGIMPVTVTGSGETAVEYPHDTKHFIIDFVTKALASQS